jgi:hypothetical protein
VNSELEPLAEQANKALIAFLRAEMQLGFTYASTAKAESGFDVNGEKRARKLAKDALDTIERSAPELPIPQSRKNCERARWSLKDFYPRHQPQFEP